MLVVLLAYYAALAAADAGGDRHPPPLPHRYTVGSHKGTSLHSSTRTSKHNRRQAVNSAGEGMGMLPPADIDALMDAKYFQPGKLPVKYAYTSVSKDMLASAWIAAVNITGTEYDLVIDNMLSDTWLYGPLDPNKCWLEGLTQYNGKNFCYQTPTNNQDPMSQDPMNMPHYINNTHPFFNNFTSYGDLGYSGMRAILNNISVAMTESAAASWPAVIELADNVYKYNPADRGSPSAGDRRYNGVLGLAKPDMSDQDIMVDNLAGGSPMQYSGSPFSAKSGWTYFTSYFNFLNDPDNLYLGLQYIDTAAYAGDLVTVATSAKSSKWAFDAGPSWQVTYQTTNNATGTKPGEKVYVPVPFEELSETGNIKLDLSSAITYLDLETARGIYSQFGGGCFTKTEFFEHMKKHGYGSSHMNHTQGDWNMTEHVNHWNSTEGHNKTHMLDLDHKEDELPWCRLPVTVNYNKDTDDQWTTVISDPQLTLPWGEDFGIKIDPESLVGDVIGRPCTGPSSRPKNEAASCQMYAYGTIQPNIVMDTHGKGNAPFWVYGGIVFQNAFVKWDTANNGTVSAAVYAKKTEGNYQSGIPSPSAKGGKSKPHGKPRRIRFPDGI
ncbi:hypothetical protein AA313_de0202301 [Arthrobotrys entomopaga]|nr:hypothetical protein AA313_de0202301 [Arthrobotrys entomopaga]